MSNRFHSKYHRQNHHTYTSATNPDAGHDPIASREQPFWGDFVLAGALSCVAPASSVAGYFNSNYTALCAIAGQRGQYIYSFGNLGLEVYSLQSTAISAVAPYMGANISSNVYGINVYGGQYGINAYSPINGINSYGGSLAGNYYSPVRALSAYGGQYALEAYSPLYGANVYGGTYGGRFYSPIRALSAYGGILGLDLYSPVSGIYAYGGSVAGVFKSPIRALSANGDIVGFEVYSPVSAINAFGGIIGTNVYSPIRAISAYGGTVGIDVYSPNIALSAYGGNTGISVYSQNLAINSNSNTTGMSLYGGSLGAVISSPTVALSTGGTGINRFDNRVGIFRTPQQNYGTSPNIVLDVNGNSYFDGDLTITGDLSTLGRMTYLDTIVQTTSSLQVINRTASAGATFIQYSNQPIMVCYDGDISTTVSSFIVDGSSNGWVGIGTNSPSAPFNIVKDNTSTQANNQPQIRLSDDNSTTKLAIGTPRTGRSNSSIGTETNHSFDIITNNTSYVTVLNTGKVGINTQTPNTTLTINGSLSSVGAADISGTTNINNTGSSSTNINTGTNTGALNLGNTSGNVTINANSLSVSTNSNVTVSAGNNSVNINTESNTGALNLGNNTGNTSLSGNTLTVKTGDTVTINGTTGRTTNINTGSGAVTTTIGNNTASNITTINSPNITAPNQTYVDGTSVITGTLGDARFNPKSVYSTTIVNSTNTTTTLTDVVKINLAANTTYYIESTVISTFTGTVGNTIQSNVNYTGTIASMALIGRESVNVSGGNQRVSKFNLGAAGLIFAANMSGTATATTDYGLITYTGTITTTTSGVLSVQTKIGTAQASDTITNQPNSIIRASALV